MGLPENSLNGIIHLALVASDIFLIVSILKIIHDHWQISWIEPILKAIWPLMSNILGSFQALMLKVTGKLYPEKILLAQLVFCISIMRLILNFL